MGEDLKRNIFKMIKDLISKFGKEKINTLTKYSSILTLHKLGEKGRLKSELTTPIQGETMYATEKIDGTNVRIICYGSEYLIGAREFILLVEFEFGNMTHEVILENLKRFIPNTNDK